MDPLSQDLRPRITNTALVHSSGDELVWDSWCLYGDPHLMAQVLEAAEELVERQFGNDFDVLVAAGWADPFVLTAMLAQRMVKPCAAFLSGRSPAPVWAPRIPSGKRVVVVDHVVNYGTHIHYVMEDLARADADVLGAVVLLDNDTSDGRLPIVKEWVAAGKIVSLIKASDIVAERGARKLRLEEEEEHPDSPGETCHKDGCDPAHLV